MADPLLDEDMLLETLKAPVLCENCHHLQNAAIFAAVAAHDRGSKREEFISATHSLMAFHGQLGKLFMMNSVREHLAAGTLTLDLIDHTANKIIAYAKGDQADVVAFMARLVQCPTSVDVVN